MRSCVKKCSPSTAIQKSSIFRTILSTMLTLTRVFISFAARKVLNTESSAMQKGKIDSLKDAEAPINSSDKPRHSARFPFGSRPKRPADSASCLDQRQIQTAWKKNSIKSTQGLAADRFQRGAINHKHPSGIHSASKRRLTAMILSWKSGALPICATIRRTRTDLRSRGQRF